MLVISSHTTGGVSLTFLELSKLFSRNLCIVEIIFRAKFELEILINVISNFVYFCEIILETALRLDTGVDISY